MHDRHRGISVERTLSDDTKQGVSCDVDAGAVLVGDALDLVPHELSIDPAPISVAAPGRRTIRGNGGAIWGELPGLSRRPGSGTSVFVRAHWTGTRSLDDQCAAVHAHLAGKFVAAGLIGH